MEVIPANSTATVFFPLKVGQKAYQQGKVVVDSLVLEAGTFEFEIK